MENARSLFMEFGLANVYPKSFLKRKHIQFLKESYELFQPQITP